MAHFYGNFGAPAMYGLRQIAEGEKGAGICNAQHKGLGGTGFTGYTGLSHSDEGYATLGEFFIECNGAMGKTAVVIYLPKIHGSQTDAVFQGDGSNFDGTEQIRIVGVHKDHSNQLSF